MSGGSELAAQLRGLGEKISLDLAAAGRAAAEIDQVCRAAASATPDRGLLARAALALDHYHTALESSFERLARVIDGGVPQGPDRHRGLLAQMASPHDARPAALSGEAEKGLRQVLQFRHFLRHAYALDLDWARMSSLAASVAPLHLLVSRDLTTLRAFIERCAEAAAGE